MLFYFIFPFRFFFSYLWDNYRTLLITVLFIRTDRLSCTNIRVIINKLVEKWHVLGLKENFLNCLADTQSYFPSTFPRLGCWKTYQGPYLVTAIQNQVKELYHLSYKSTALIAFKNWTFVTFKQRFSYNHTWPCQVVAYAKQKTTEYVKFLV